MLCWQFMLTLSDAIGLLVLAVLFGIVLLVLAINGLCLLYEWLKEKISYIWRKMVY
jgi:hypothetical protein